MLTDTQQHKRTARIIGALFLISYAGVFIGAEVTGSVLNESDYLVNAFPERAQVTIGVLIELLNDLAIVGIAVLLYPFLRKASEGIALLYVGLRVLEASFLMMAKVSSLAMIDLSEGFLAAGASDAASFESLGSLAKAFQDASGQMGAMAFIAGGVALYYLLLQTELVPRFIPVWGLFALGSLVAAMAFGVPDLTQGFEPAMLLYFPIVVNELFLAGWLLIKGFGTPSLTPEPRSPVLAGRS